MKRLQLFLACAVLGGLIAASGAALAQRSLQGAHTPVGPYAQARLTRDFIFISGQGPLDPRTKKLIHGDFDAAARQVLRNVGTALHEDGVDYSHVVKITVYLTDIRNVTAFNRISPEFFGKHPPARVVVGVNGLVYGVPIVVDAIASRT